MKNMKKKVAFGISYAAVAALAVSGTAAYLTSTESDVNMMTLDNVKIEQIEQERADMAVFGEDAVLQDYTQNKPLYPAVYEGSSIPWAAESDWLKPGEQAWKVVEANANVVDKFVTVKNTGDSAAYVRTIMAFEGDVIGDNDPIHVITNGTNVPEEIGALEWIDDVVIDGTEYDVAVATYQKPLAPGETTIPSLKQVYLDKTATNAVVESFGDTYDILVLSQAVQTKGFSDAATALNQAFGEITSANHPWLANTDWYTADVTEYTISTAEELLGFAELVNEDGVNFKNKTVKLDADINLAGHEWTPIGQTGATEFKGIFDGQNHTISNMNIDSSDETGEYYASGLFGWVEDHGEGIVIKNVTIDGATVTGHHNVAGVVGYVYGTVENCHVTNAAISCTYANEGASGDKCGAIAGYVGESAVIQNCSASDVSISAGRDAGQIVGAALAKCVTDCTATNVTVVANGTGTGKNINEEIIGRVL